jgi:hypothetical protein
MPSSNESPILQSNVTSQRTSKSTELPSPLSVCNMLKNLDKDIFFDEIAVKCKKQLREKEFMNTSKIFTVIVEPEKQAYFNKIFCAASSNQNIRELNDSFRLKKNGIAIYGLTSTSLKLRKL